MSGFDWNTPFANTRTPAPADITPASVAKIMPTDLNINPNNLKPAQNQAPTPDSQVSPLNFGSFSTINTIVGTANILILPAPSTKRIYLLIQNVSAANNLFVGFGNAVTPTTGIKIPPGGNYELNAIIPQDDVNIVADGLNTACAIIYSNKGINEGV